MMVKRNIRQREPNDQETLQNWRKEGKIKQIDREIQNAQRYL